MNAPFHDDAMLDDAMLVDALNSIEYMNGITKDAAPVEGSAIMSTEGDHQAFEDEPNSAFHAATDAPLSAVEGQTTLSRVENTDKVVSVGETSPTGPTAASTIPVSRTPVVDSSSATTPACTQSMQLEAASTGAGSTQHSGSSASPYKQIVVTKESGLLGFGVLPVRGVCGVQVSTLQPDSSAAKAGLRVGDVLLKLDDTDVSNMAMPAIIQILQAVVTGKPLHISLFRPSVAVPTTAPISMSKPLTSALAQRGPSTDASLAPSAKKAKTSNVGASFSNSSLPGAATSFVDTATLKKQLDAMTKDLQVAMADKVKLAEKNAMLRKRVQHMVIAGDEDKVKLKAEFEQRIAALVQEKAQLQNSLATVKAQARLDSRAVFDTDVTKELKTQLEALQRQVDQFEALERKRKDVRKAHASIELKLADKCKMQLLRAIVDKVTGELKAISQLRAQSSLRTNAFGAAGTASTTPSHVKVQFELIRRVSVNQLFGIHAATDPLGFPVLSQLQMTLPESRIAEVVPNTRYTRGTEALS
ncbi:hypothetical protein DYB32_001344 [Aphanomyces invadans]|uniref:PDZ domain-containing protein n=1 Tax=Aphanomyces invadans TaxID=157072 RepID=A0A3R7D6J5_9STRA|nr:hypothetical protein DYB32_001344 [Aphanomyces invadans]